ncbi:hypothetical protein ACWS7L_12835 [Exiguobacterium artemiae]|uniref:hypothetical protein n=1 Tax=Exiguobacterium sp. S22-S28 TaxID=3342768 RepID=UPI0011CA2A59
MTNFWKANGKWRIGRFIFLAILLVLVSCFLYTFHQKILRQLYLEDQLEQQYGLEKDEYQVKSYISKYGYGYDLILEDEPRTSYSFNVREKNGEYIAIYSGYGFRDGPRDENDFRAPEHIEFEQFKDEP